MPVDASTFRAIVFDLDGVIRHFEPTFAGVVEGRHALPSGVLEQTAFASPLIVEVTTGVISRAQWTDRIGAAVGSHAAAEEWLAAPATVDPGMMALIGELRSAGYLVAIYTNGTDTIPAELAANGLDQVVDEVFNSAEIGFAKPDHAGFRHVCEALGVDPAEAFFTDDSPSKLVGAEAVGMTTHHFTDEAALRRRLAALAILP